MDAASVLLSPLPLEFTSRMVHHFSDAMGILAASSPASPSRSGSPAGQGYIIYVLVRCCLFGLLGVGVRRAIGRAVLVICLLACIGVVGASFLWSPKSSYAVAPQAPAIAAPSPARFVDNSVAAMQGVQAIVKSYMWSHASVPTSIEFLDWSNLSQAGDDWSVNLHYSALQRTGSRTTANVRFTVRGGAVVNAQVL